MKINNIKNVSNYKRNTYTKKDKKVESGKFDSILISRSNKNEDSSFEVTKMKSRIMNNISSDISAERFTAIKRQVNNGEYEINAENLADILLK